MASHAMRSCASDKALAALLPTIMPTTIIAYRVSIVAGHRHMYDDNGYRAAIRHITPALPR